MNYLPLAERWWSKFSKLSIYEYIQKCIDEGSIKSHEKIMLETYLKGYADGRRKRADNILSSKDILIM